MIRAQSISTLDVEAALIFRIAPFVDQNIYDDTKFCILGSPRYEIYDVLKSNVENKMLGSKKVSVSKVSNSTIKNSKCSILILPNKVAVDSLQKILSETQGLIIISLNNENHVLSHFVLKRVENKIKFDANIKKIKDDDVKISSKLLRLADRTY
ncbi:PF13689 domain protein [Bacteriovorax sp. Seq25_V]|nr:PF13689 domain protein [Bacteriovorax sp. Seq25_V]